MTEAALAELRAAFSELMGAERRFRGRGPARPGELSNAQIRAIWDLKHGEQCTSGAIAKRAELSPASVTAMLDQLEKEGMVTRRRSEQDRRQVIVTLTDAGHAALEAKRASWEGHWLRGLAEHSEEELETAVRVIRSMARMLDGVGATPVEDGGSHPVQSA